MSRDRTLKFPWKDEKDFHIIFHDIFPLKALSQKYANFDKLIPNLGKMMSSLRLLKVWTRRSSDSMFSVTYELIKKVTEILQSGSSSDKEVLIDSLSLGLVKIVNAVVDDKQFKNQFNKKKSMTSIASDIGFSVRAVRERNTIAHSQKTPCLRQLIECYKEMYVWTYRTWWLPIQKDLVRDLDTYFEVKAHLEALQPPELKTFESEIENVKSMRVGIF